LVALPRFAVALPAHASPLRATEPTFLNLGVNYPNPRRFTVVIWIENRSAFGRPEARYRGRTICVRGSVRSYRGVPEIEARSPTQIKVIG
jgi:hypothetical protein